MAMLILDAYVAGLYVGFKKTAGVLNVLDKGLNYGLRGLMLADAAHGAATGRYTVGEAAGGVAAPHYAGGTASKAIGHMTKNKGALAKGLGIAGSIATDTAAYAGGSHLGKKIVPFRVGGAKKKPAQLPVEAPDFDEVNPPKKSKPRGV
jgi:hypothetical protein